MRNATLLLAALGFGLTACAEKAETAPADAPAAQTPAADTAGPSVEIRTDTDTVKVSDSDVDVKVKIGSAAP